MVRRALLLAAAVSALVSCGKEAGRVPFSTEGSATAPLTLNAGNVDFWTDIDIKWEGDATLAYVVELAQGGATVTTATCDPLAGLHVKMSWVETNIGSSHSRRGRGKMTCSATLASGG